MLKIGAKKNSDKKCPKITFEKKYLAALEKQQKPKKKFFQTSKNQQKFTKKEEIFL